MQLIDRVDGFRLQARVAQADLRQPDSPRPNNAAAQISESLVTNAALCLSYPAPASCNPIASA
jgi:hypothetical protein